jgi:hypothetical protein
MQIFTSADITAKDKLEASIQSDERRVLEATVIERQLALMGASQRYADSRRINAS